MRYCVYCKTRYEKGSGVTFHKFPSDYTLKLWLKKMKLDNWTPKTWDSLCSKHFTDDCFIKHESRTTLKKCSIPTIFHETDSSLVAAPTDLSADDNQSSQDCEMNFAKSKSPFDNSICIAAMQMELSNDDCQHSQIIPNEILTCQAFATRSTTPVPSTSYDTSQPSTSCNANQLFSTPKRTREEIYAAIKLDHRYENTPKSSKRRFERVRRALRKSQTRIKVLSQKVKRLKIRVSSLKTVIAHLKKKKLVCDDCVSMLNQYDDFKPQIFKTGSEAIYCSYSSFLYYEWPSWPKCIPDTHF